MNKITRRVVTGHNAAGKAVILQDGPVPRVFDQLGQEGLVFMEVWETRATPAPIEATEDEPTDHDLQLTPPKNGVRIRVLDIPPDEGSFGDNVEEEAKAVFEKIGAGSAHTDNAPHPFMHRTETVDFGIVLDGELVLILDEGETTLHKGDIVVQRGTNHAWSNRSDKPCRIAFILTDGAFGPSLK